MLKKYDKIDLRSNNYKITKTPEKKQTDSLRTPHHNTSPIKYRQSSEIIDPNDLFQKVCCPNCRFIFKIIKNNELINQRSLSKKNITHHAIVQTEQMFVKELKNLSKMSLELSQKQTNRQSQSSIFRTGLIKHNNITKSQMIKQPDHLQSSTYKFPEHSPIKNNIRRLTYLNTSKKQEQSSLFEQPSKDLTPKSKPKDTENQIQTQILLQEQRKRISLEMREQLKRELRVLPELVEYQFKNRKTIDNLLAFYTDLPASIDVPSYCKMLISDYQIKKSQPQKPFNLS